MSASELKIEIVKRLVEIEDEEVLQEILRLISSESEIRELQEQSDEKFKPIKLDLDDGQGGRIHSSEAAWDMIKQWLRQ